MTKEQISKIATPQQLKAILFIQKTCNVNFYGETRRDVADFIRMWLPKAKSLSGVEEELSNLKVQTAEVHMPKKGYTQEVPDWSSKDGIARELFEGAILRGQNPTEALMDLEVGIFQEQLEETFDDIRESTGLPLYHRSMPF